MKKFKNAEMAHAWSVAGWRERYAMEHGNRATIYQGGEKCYRFTYSTMNEYQDANGATYNTARTVADYKDFEDSGIIKNLQLLDEHGDPVKDGAEV